MSICSNCINNCPLDTKQFLKNFGLAFADELTREIVDCDFYNKGDDYFEQKGKA